MNKLIDETGNTYGRLTVIERVENNAQGKARWLCICECGVDKVVRGNSLRHGDTQSCGCFQKGHAITHGLVGKPEYRIWQAMKARCGNSNHSEFSNYGGRGIKVCERWRSSVEIFYADMGPRPTPKHSLDRIDGDGDYSPANCRWATKKEQARNMRINRNIAFDGRRQCVTAWAEELGMNRGTLSTRLHRGWSIERALTEPIRSTSS